MSSALFEENFLPRNAIFDVATRHLGFSFSPTFCSTTFALLAANFLLVCLSFLFHLSDAKQGDFAMFLTLPVQVKHFFYWVHYLSKGTFSESIKMMRRRLARHKSALNKSIFVSVQNDFLAEFGTTQMKHFFCMHWAIRLQPRKACRMGISGYAKKPLHVLRTICKEQKSIFAKGLCLLHFTLQTLDQMHTKSYKCL